jgi:nucleotide-binding universal stress UspA family protein
MMHDPTRSAKARSGTPGRRLDLDFAWRGIAAERRSVEGRDERGNALLRTARESGADLMVVAARG